MKGVEALMVQFRGVLEKSKKRGFLTRRLSFRKMAACCFFIVNRERRMKKVRSLHNMSWIPYKNLVEFYTCSATPNFDAPLTTVHGFFFREGRLLLVRHKTRGWEVPGGHLENSETPEAAMHRELFEEAQMNCDELQVLGFLKKTARQEKPKVCPYPYPLSYCLFYQAEISQIEPFCGDDSIVEARFFSIEEAAQTKWIKDYYEYFEEAQTALKRNSAD